MFSHCCYRLVPNGTVIHDKIDWQTRTLMDYPKLLRPGALKDEKFGNIFVLNHNREERDNYQMCESALLSDKSYMLCIDWNNVQYDCYTMKGTVECRRVPEHIPYVTYDHFALDIDDYAAVGVEVTEYAQLRFSCGSVFRIAYANGVIHTSYGRFTLSPELCDRLRKWRPDYTYYKLIRDPENDLIGYLFLDTGYAFLSVNGDGELSIKEVPYGNKI